MGGGEEDPCLCCSGRLLGEARPTTSPVHLSLSLGLGLSTVTQLPSTRGPEFVAQFLAAGGGASWHCATDDNSGGCPLLVHTSSCVFHTGHLRKGREWPNVRGGERLGFAALTSWAWTSLSLSCARVRVCARTKAALAQCGAGRREARTSCTHLSNSWVAPSSRGTRP